MQGSGGKAASIYRKGPQPHFSSSCTTPSCRCPPISLMGCTVLPCDCVAWHSHVLPWKVRAASPPVAVPRLGGWGTIFFPGRLCFEGRCITARGAQGPTLKVLGRTPGGWWFATGSGPASTVPLSRSGAARICWLETRPHYPCLGDSTAVLVRASSP